MNNNLLLVIRFWFTIYMKRLVNDLVVSQISTRKWQMSCYIRNLMSVLVIVSASPNIDTFYIISHELSWTSVDQVAPRAKVTGLYSHHSLGLCHYFSIPRKIPTRDDWWERNSRIDFILYPSQFAKDESSHLRIYKSRNLTMRWIKPTITLSGVCFLFYGLFSDWLKSGSICCSRSSGGLQGDKSVSRNVN